MGEPPLPPETSWLPSPFGADGFVMSTKPIRPPAASVYARVLPSSETAEISATVPSAGSVPAGTFSKTG